MKVIHKFPLKLTDSQQIKMPERAEILSVQMQGGVPCIWAQVDTDYDLETRLFYIYGTGHRMDDFAVMKFIGTVQEGQFVWHVFQVL